MKAHRQTEKIQAQNRQMRARLRTSLKEIRTAIGAGDFEKANGLLSETCSVIDKMAGKGIIHDNAAGRHKSRLVKRVRAAAPASA